MHECLHQMWQNSPHLMAATTGFERSDHCLERCLERTSEALCALWNNFRCDLVQARIGAVHIDQRFHERACEVIERSARMPRHRLFDDHPHLLGVALMQSREDGSLVRKVLVDRADADSGGIGDAVRGQSVRSFTCEHPLYRLEHRLHSLPRTFLARGTPNADSFVGDLHSQRSQSLVMTPFEQTCGRHVVGARASWTTSGCKVNRPCQPGAVARDRQV